MTIKTWVTAIATGSFLASATAFAEMNTSLSSPQTEGAQSTVILPVIKPYRTFVTIKRYNLENNGAPSKPISNVRLEIKFPGGYQVQLPEGGQYWTIGNNQSQEINRTFEIPFEMIQRDGFAFELQMIRKGKKILPCKFEVTQLSQFNRSYVCRTDVAYQQNQNTPEEKISKEAVEVRVFSDLNSPASEIPKDAIALR